MKAKIRYTLEMVLYSVLWLGEDICRPSYRALGESFEGWLYRHRLLNRVHQLEAERFLERTQAASGIGEAIMRLTESGKRRALGGRDPSVEWEREWDGVWRFVIFDVPEEQRGARQQLRRLLKRFHFGRLQDSMWLTPGLVDPVLHELAEAGGDPSGLIIVPTDVTTEKDNSRIVGKAWNFEVIGERYQAYLDFLEEGCGEELSLEATTLWLCKERRLWMKSISSDPFLPKALLPANYLGREAWNRRQAIMHECRAHLMRQGRGLEAISLDQVEVRGRVALPEFGGFHDRIAACVTV